MDFCWSWFSQRPSKIEMCHGSCLLTLHFSVKSILSSLWIVRTSGTRKLKPKRLRTCRHWTPRTPILNWPMKVLHIATILYFAAKVQKAWNSFSRFRRIIAMKLWFRVLHVDQTRWKGIRTLVLASKAGSVATRSALIAASTTGENDIPSAASQCKKRLMMSGTIFLRSL